MKNTITVAEAVEKLKKHIGMPFVQLALARGVKLGNTYIYYVYERKIEFFQVPTDLLAGYYFSVDVFFTFTEVLALGLSLMSGRYSFYKSSYFSPRNLEEIQNLSNSIIIPKVKMSIFSGTIFLHALSFEHLPLIQPCEEREGSAFLPVFFALLLLLLVKCVNELLARLQLF